MKKEKDIITQLRSGILTESMDIGSREYEDFKLLIRSKVSETSKEDRIKIALIGLKYQMNDYLSTRSKATKVGNYIKQFIEVLEIKQVEFAKYIGIRPSNLSKLINGDRRLNIEFALILEKLSNINAEVWLRIQNQNEIRKIKKTNSSQIRKYKLKELISRE